MTTRGRKRIRLPDKAVPAILHFMTQVPEYNTLDHE